MRPVIPCYIKFGDALVNPCYDVIEFSHMLILLLSAISFYKSHLYIMPPFVPNDYMLKTHADKVKPSGDNEKIEDYDIYAWCVRDAMATESGFGTSDMPMSKKLEYEDFVNFRRQYVEYNDVVYYQKDSKPKGDLP